MRIGNRLFRYAVIAIVVGAYVSPFISYASFPEDIQRIHEESAQQREERREQFRQNVLEKRKEMISKWHGRTQELKGRLKEGGQEIKSGFEIRQSEDVHAVASSSIATTTPEQEEPKKENFFSIVKKRVNNITHLFSQFGNLFGGNQ